MNAPGRAQRTAILGPCLVWLACAGPFLIAEERLMGVSRAALAALPWIAYAGLPRRSGAAARPGDTAFELALLLPPLALGAWIDLAAGAAPEHVATVAIVSAVLVALLSTGARLAAAGAALRWHAIAWITLVAGLPLLASALVLGGAPHFGTAPAWMSWLAGASPIAWTIAQLDVGDASARLAWGPFLVALALLAIGALGARSASEGNRGGVHGEDLDEEQGEEVQA